MTPKRAARIAAFVTLGVVGVVSFGRAAIAGFWDLLINAPFLTALWGAPLAAAAGILTYRWRMATDSPETDVARSSDEWIAAVRSELAAVEDPPSVGTSPGRWSSFGARSPRGRGCSPMRRRRARAGSAGVVAGTGGGRVGDFTLFVPPLAFFAVGAVAARRLDSFSGGLVVAAAVAVLSAVVMLPVAATEAAHLYPEAGVSLLDGETAQVDSTSAAVLDTLHPVFIVLTSSSGSPTRARRPAGSSRSTAQPAVPAWRSGINPVRV